MSYLDVAVEVDLTATTATVSVPGTEIPAIIGYHTHWTDRRRFYEDLPGMVADGFSTTEPLYYMAQSVFEQNPRPEKVCVIRGTTSVAQTMTFKVTDTQTGHVVGLILTKPDGTTVAIQHTVTVGQTAAQIASALQAIVVSGLTLTVDVGDTTQLDIAVTASGDIWYPSAITGGQFTDTTTSASPGTDLDATLLVDNTWYEISGEWLSAANIQAIAVWAEANKRLHAYTTADYANTQASSGIMHTLQAAAYKRSIGLYTGTPIDYGATGWVAAALVPFPGAYNLAYKSIAGEPVDSLSPTDITNIQGNNGNFNINLSTATGASTPVAIDGRSAQGQFVDLQIGMDGLTQDIQQSVGTLLVSTPRIPYTNLGMTAIKNAVSGALQRAVDGGFLSSDAGHEFAVTIPDPATQAPADRTNRIVKKVMFTCYAQNAVNMVKIQGTVNV